MALAMARELERHLGVGNHVLNARVPSDQLAILSRQGRARRGQIVDRLQQVCLALGVISHQQVNARREIDLQARIVTKLVQLQAANQHRDT